MLEIINSLFKVGDGIILTLNDGTVLKGTIFNLSDSLIVIKDNYNHMIGVKGTLIDSFEQVSLEKTIIETPRKEQKKDVKIIDKIPIEQLLRTDPKLKKRFPNLAKEQDNKVQQPTTSTQGNNNDNSDYIGRVDRLVRSTKVDDAISYIDDLLYDKTIGDKNRSNLLLRKAQLLSAQNRRREAAQAYVELISLNKRSGASNNNISHLYTELGRLQMLFDDSYDRAAESIEMALKYNKDNAAAGNLLLKIESAKSQAQDVNMATATDLVIEAKEETLVPSVMIITDIKEHKYDNPKIINSRQITTQIANTLLADAKKAREESKSQSFLMFLEAAKAYSELPVGSYDYQNYLYAMAYYALLKADSLFAKYKNMSRVQPPDLSELILLKDIACSYYRESLNLVFDVTPESLAAIITNYLKLEIAQQQANKGQRTYFNGELKPVFSDCISGGNNELKNSAIRMVLSCGAASVKVWNVLCQEASVGTLLADKVVRLDVYETINMLGKTNISSSLSPKEFFKKAFELWREKEQGLLSCINEFEFDIRAISNLAEKWKKIENYSNLFLETDLQSKHVADNILVILSPYLNRNQAERTNLLIRAQRIIDNQLKFIESHTTYYGRAFFFVLFNKWKKDVDDLISDKLAKSYPSMQINYDPPFFVKSEEGRMVNLTVQNVGESTADGCNMRIKIETDKVDVNNPQGKLELQINKEIPAGTKLGYQLFIPKEIYPKAKMLYVTIEVAPIFLGNPLEIKEFSSTIEEEPELQLTYDDILWNDGPIPAYNLFKGRQEDIQNLSQHYLSVEKDKPYILYGLTRTGKSSILKFLKDDIDSNTFKQAGREMIVFPVIWDFSVAASYDYSSDFWDYIIRGTLMEDLKLFADRNGIDFNDFILPSNSSAKDLPTVLKVLNDKQIYPFFLVDEFSYVKTLIDNNIVNSAFLHTLRQYSLEGLASFLYAGTYDIKTLIKDPKYGITGQLVNAISKQVSEIKPKDAEELMNVMSDQLRFTHEAIGHIHQLSGDIPYFIQIICKNCGYYASDFKRSVIGYPELEKVIEILTGEKEPYSKTLLTPLTEFTFQNNQFSPLDPPEVAALISSIVYYNQNNPLNPRGVSSEEIEHLWENNGIMDKQKLHNAFQNLTEKRVLVCSDDDGMPVYSFSVDLFRRWWTVAHPDFNLDIAEMK